jgi:hypothetical protein
MQEGLSYPDPNGVMPSTPPPLTPCLPPFPPLNDLPPSALELLSPFP